MNKEDFVTYEQALALKKLGFDYKCNHFYENDGTFKEDNCYGSCNTSKIEYYRKENYADAPTLAQAQKWLRECKELIVIPNPYRDCKGNVVWYFTIFNSGNYKHSSTYNSYEEALSAGITECLKLLEK